jgi:hypothetical protein
MKPKLENGTRLVRDSRLRLLWTSQGRWIAPVGRASDRGLAWTRAMGLGLLLVFAPRPASAGTGPYRRPEPAAGSPSARSATTTASVTNAAVRRLDDGRLQLGQVIVDPRQRAVIIPAVVNLTGGLMEYLLVSDTGKVHESVLRTAAQPYHVKTAMLLLGARGATNADPAAFGDPAREIPGDKLMVELAWKLGNVAVRSSAEDWIRNLHTGAPMTRGAWVYTGSWIDSGTFVAQRDGSIVAIIGDPDALVNNPRLGRENDEIWTPNTNALPALQTPVEVILRLEQPSAPAP